MKCFNDYMEELKGLSLEELKKRIEKSGGKIYERKS